MKKKVISGLLALVISFPPGLSLARKDNELERRVRCYSYRMTADSCFNIGLRGEDCEIIARSKEGREREICKLSCEEGTRLLLKAKEGRIIDEKLLNIVVAILELKVMNACLKETNEKMKGR